MSQRSKVQWTLKDIREAVDFHTEHVDQTTGVFTEAARAADVDCTLCPGARDEKTGGPFRSIAQATCPYRDYNSVQNPGRGWYDGIPAEELVMIVAKVLMDPLYVDLLKAKEIADE